MDIRGLVQVVFIVLIMWLSQVLKAMIIIPMPWQDSEVQELSTYKCHVQVVDDLLDIFDGLQRYELKLANWMIMRQPRYISYWSFHLGAYELIELDKYAMLLAISGLNGFMSCESIQTTWFQVWFIYDKV